ncbi:MAG: serine hydrolase domain-containing protein [Candidatus Aminicenantes bacterium]
MKKITLLVLLLLILFLVSLTAREPGSGQNATPPRAPERFARVRAMILEALEKGGAPSVSIAVAENGKVVWEESFGYADKEKKIPATPDSIYALASISKSFTGTGLMVLAERKLIALDRPVNDYLGEAKLTVHAGDARQVTLRRMLHMEAGMPMHWNIYDTSKAARPPSQDESIRRYGIVVNEQGREYVYSNFTYGVLDRVISRVSGKGYSQFMREEVFTPLGLRRTSVHFTPDLAPHVVQNYDAAGNPLAPLAYDHDGASAVHASVHDLIRFGLFHLNNRVPGQKAVLGPDSLDLLHEPSPLIASGAGEIGEPRMAMGWGIIDLAGRRFVVASGSAPGTTSRLALIPEKNSAVALLCNASLSDAFALWKIEWETFAALIPDFPEMPAIPEDKPPAFVPPLELVGEWQGAVQTYQGHVPMTLTMRGGQEVTIEIDGRTGAPIPMNTPLGPLGFRNGWLSGLFFGSIPTEDARRSPHVVFLRLRLQGDTLSGTVSAVAVNQSFALPYWASLERRRQL